jgi:aromatic ring-opening dioxygenase catalytic subunit (LigB family)
MPLLNDPSHKAITASLRTRVPQLLHLSTANPSELPRAILVITAHWSQPHPTISSAASHSLYYDYGGFPPEAYEFAYPAPGSPEVAQEAAAALRDAGFAPVLDERRGWDHGVFVPLMLIEPKARVPIVQVSVLADEDPKRHFEMGKALGRLREKGVAIVGSGFATFHNLRLMFGGVMRDEGFRERNREWSRVVGEAVGEEGWEERGKKMEGWRKWPGAYEMHPRGGAEHFMPLIVCAGAGGEGKGESYGDEFMGLDMWSYYWT